jgi:hypothetical protein
VRKDMGSRKREIFPGGKQITRRKEKKKKNNSEKRRGIKEERDPARGKENSFKNRQEKEKSQ